MVEKEGEKKEQGDEFALLPQPLSYYGNDTVLKKIHTSQTLAFGQEANTVLLEHVYVLLKRAHVLLEHVEGK